MLLIKAFIPLYTEFKMIANSKTVFVIVLLSTCFVQKAMSSDDVKNKIETNSTIEDERSSKCIFSEFFYSSTLLIKFSH